MILCPESQPWINVHIPSVQKITVFLADKDLIYVDVFFGFLNVKTQNNPPPSIELRIGTTGKLELWANLPNVGFKMSAFFFQRALRCEHVSLWRALMETFYGTFRRCVAHGGYFSPRAKRWVQISSARAFVYFTFTKGCDASSWRLWSSLKIRTI